MRSWKRKSGKREVDGDIIFFLKQINVGTYQLDVILIDKDDKISVYRVQVPFNPKDVGARVQRYNGVYCPHGLRDRLEPSILEILKAVFGSGSTKQDS